MIKFFSRIRRKLIDEGNLKRYLIYAAGEILLVMIGILLALQVNNWNESNRLAATKITYLKEIRNDLVQDSLSISAVIHKYKQRLSNLLEQDSTIQPSFNDDIIGKLPTADKETAIKYYLRSAQPFRPKRGTYNSLISEGKSSLITNRRLFNQIQVLYEEEYPSLVETDNVVFETSLRMLEKHAQAIKYADWESPVKIQDKQILADINYIYDIQSFYTYQSITVQRKIADLISALDVEIESSKPYLNK